MSKNLTVPFLLLILVPLITNPPVQPKRIHLFNNIVFTDHAPAVKMQYYKSNASAEYPIIYIGEPVDTISMELQPTPGLYREYPRQIPAYTRCLQGNIAVKIDTIVFSSLYSYEYRTHLPVRVPAYALIIRNTSSSTVYMGLHTILYTARTERQLEKGCWMEIDTPAYRNSLCGANQPEQLLYPGEIMVAKIPWSPALTYGRSRIVIGYENDTVCSNIFTARN